jgi:hydroxymethylbilane synthase
MKDSGTFYEFEIIEINTTGDKCQNVSLDTIGGKGVFIKEIEDALLREEIDMAVHSLKDMPAELHEDLVLAAFLPREDVSDCLISRNGLNFEDLPAGAVVGTSSLRRVYQAKCLRPDLEVQSIRGNVNTRLRKLDEGQYDAIILASAGLIRLGMTKRITQKLPLNQFIPAICQGIIAIEAKKDNKELISQLKNSDDHMSRKAALCERAFLRRLNGNCKIPIGAYCHLEDNHFYLNGMLGDPEKLFIYQDSLSGKSEDAEMIGCQLAEQILALMSSK